MNKRRTGHLHGWDKRVSSIEHLATRRRGHFQNIMFTWTHNRQFTWSMTWNDTTDFKKTYFSIRYSSMTVRSFSTWVLFVVVENVLVADARTARPIWDRIAVFNKDIFNRGWKGFFVSTVYGLFWIRYQMQCLACRMLMGGVVLICVWEQTMPPGAGSQPLWTKEFLWCGRWWANHHWS